MAKDFRIQSYGSSSAYRDTEDAAFGAAQDVLSQNGCGNIQQRQRNGLWQIIARFEPYYGIVAA